MIYLSEPSVFCSVYQLQNTYHWTLFLRECSIAYYHYRPIFYQWFIGIVIEFHLDKFWYQDERYGEKVIFRSSAINYQARYCNLTPCYFSFSSSIWKNLRQAELRKLFMTYPPNSVKPLSLVVQIYFQTIIINSWWFD